MQINGVITVIFTVMLTDLTVMNVNTVARFISLLEVPKTAFI